MQGPQPAALELKSIALGSVILQRVATKYILLISRKQIKSTQKSLFSLENKLVMWQGEFFKIYIVNW